MTGKPAGGVGEGVRAAGIPRGQIFITTKVATENKSYESAAASIDESLRKLGMDYADLIIIHCPQPWAEFRGAKRYFKENKQVWKALEDAYEAGKVKSIGVSNFLMDDLQNILEDCRIKPMVNQILLHIGETPRDLLTFCREQDILVEAYSPIAHGQALHNADIGQDYGDDSWWPVFSKKKQVYFAGFGKYFLPYQNFTPYLYRERYK